MAIEEAGELLKSAVANHSQEDMPARDKAAEAAFLEAFVEELGQVAEDEQLMLRLVATMPAVEEQQQPAIVAQE